MTLKITPHNNGICLEVQVQPRSSRSQIVGVTEGRLKIKLTAPPVEGEANQALIDFLARELDLPRRNISLLRGETSRYKLVAIFGLSPEQLREKLPISKE